LRGYFLALATLGFAEIIVVLVNENAWLTKGPFGITQIPSLRIGVIVFNSYEKFYYLIWLALGLMFVFSKNLVNSREGRALQAISVSDLVASTIGIDTARFKVKVFVLSATFAGIAGSFYAFFMSAISPADFTINLSLLVIMMVIIGGMGDLTGAILGAFVLTGISEALSQSKEYSLSFYGILLVVLLIFMPDGIYLGLVDLARKMSSFLGKFYKVAG
jgi:branched-chain amino acid transport system permease protein